MKKTFRNVIIFALALCFVSAALSLCACKKTPQTIETDYCAYSEIPADYTPEQAEADGCLVVYQSQGTIKNSTVMTDFAKTTKKGSPALLRVATYYEKVVTGGEPELVVVDIEYKDGIYRTHYEQVNEDGTKEQVEVSPRTEKAKIVKRPVPLNDTNPLWTKHPNDCTEEEYRDFYRKVFQDFKEPLFWIHLNMDYPFNLKGILYFPKIASEYESIEGTIKLYNNQVFIADNIKEVIPEFLMLLKGVIDCPDLPLNVSRSALQNDGFVQKISDYITKKVADKLSGMCKTDRENYEKYYQIRLLKRREILR